MADKQDIPEPPKSAPDPTRPGSVGYRSPPEATRFKPGISGNPKGRPSRGPSIARTLREVMSRKISVSENGKIKKVQTFEAMLRATAAKAMRGDVRSTALLIGLMETHKVSVGPEQRHELHIRFINPDPDLVAKMERGE